MAARTLTRFYTTPRVAFSGIGRLLLAIDAAYRSRRALGNLDRRLLDDVGLTPEQAETEARRAPWNPPGHWRR